MKIEPGCAAAGIQGVREVFADAVYLWYLSPKAYLGSFVAPPGPRRRPAARGARITGARRPRPRAPIARTRL